MYTTAERPWNSPAAIGRSAARPNPHTIATSAMNFRSAGACVGHDPEFFFPASHGGKVSKHETAAKRICQDCPVLAVCRAWVDANPKLTEFGIWAGTTEHERRAAALKAVQASGVPQ